MDQLLPDRAMTEIRFAPPCETITLNGRDHWAVKAERTAEWRRAAGWAAVAACGRTPAERAHPPCLVTVTIPVKGRRRRDPHNWVATVKPIIDGLVDAGVWPDDDGAHVMTAEPIMQLGGVDVVVQLRTRSAEVRT